MGVTNINRSDALAVRCIQAAGSARQVDIMLVNLVLRLVIFVAGILGSCARNVSHRTPLYIGGLMPVLNGTFQPGLISQAGSKQAVEDINNRSDVLPGYEIILEWADTEVRVYIFPSSQSCSGCTSKTYEH